MEKDKYWLSVIFPIAAISSGFSVIIPLYILELHGNVVDVSLATTAYSLAVIPASLFWGELTQRLKKIKFFIMLSVIGVIPLIVLLYLLHSILLAVIIYAAYAFILTASSPAINMLIMNRRKKTVLRSYYGIYGLMSIIGNLIGYLPGVLLFSDVIARYLLILFAFNIASLLFTIFFVKEEKQRIKEDKEKHLHRMFPMFNAISKFPQILAGHHLIIQIAEMRKRKKTIRIMTIFAAIALVNFGIYLFNTSYIPFLYSYKISYSEIFLINMLNGFGQIVIYLVFMLGKAKNTLRKYYRLSTIVRSAGYLIAIISIISLTAVFYLNLFSYFIAGLGYALWNISASVIIYVNIVGKMEAHYIGVWSAIIGLSGVLGAISSGFLSLYLGYIFTFILSILFTLSSILVFNRAYVDGHKIRDFGNKV
ncbi:MAG: MFS transporter [Candidatus Parvarchaeum sp.]